MSHYDLQERARKIARAALECSEGQRNAWLRDQCSGESKLESLVREILELEQQDTVLSDAKPTESGTQILPGSIIQCYTLREAIGEGGFAEVFLAEQTEPVRRKVALKILKPGLESREILARFEAERQALAIMQHPGVATIIDAGVTENGRSWFSMEYVDGLPITEYCDTNRLTLRERLMLFSQICEAVQHAHQKGIIHRDLKPSNILVGLSQGTPQAKVIDFGIAKATGPHLTDKTLFTSHGMMIGTPAYMSPEQAEMSGIDIDTRSDIYSLGVILYELLSGEPPFLPKSLVEAGYGEIQRIIREEEPRLPSTKATTIEEASKVAKARQLSLSALRKRLSGDLDWITMKSLEKDRTRRYVTVQELAADLERHLTNEPVSAGPPSLSYRCRKFIRRNRAGVITAALVLLALGAGIVTTTWQWQEAKRSERQARKSESRADAEKKNLKWETLRLEKVVLFQEEALTKVDPHRMGVTMMQEFRKGLEQELARAGRNQHEIKQAVTQFSSLASHANPTTVSRSLVEEEILKPAIKALEDGLSQDGDIDRRLSRMLADAYSRIGLPEKAIAIYRKSFERMRENYGDENPLTLILMNQFSRTLMRYHKSSDFDKTRAFLEKALELNTRVLGRDAEDSLSAADNLGVFLMSSERYNEAEPFFRKTLATRKRVFGESSLETLNSLQNLAELSWKQGKANEGVKYARKALELSKRLNGEEHSSTLLGYGLMGASLFAQEEFDESVKYLQKNLQLSRKLKGEDHPMTLRTMAQVGKMLSKMGKKDESEAILLRHLEINRRIYGDDVPETVEATRHLVNIFQAHGKHDEAELLLRKLLGSYRRLHGEEHPETLSYMVNLGLTLSAKGKLQEAEALMQEALKGFTRVNGSDHPNTLFASSAKIRLLQKQGKHDEAEVFAREVLNMYRRVYGNEAPETLLEIDNLAVVLLNRGKLEEATTLFREFLRVGKRIWGINHASTLSGAEKLIICLIRGRKWEEAEALTNEVINLTPEDTAPHEKFAKIASEIKKLRKESATEDKEAEPEEKR